MKRTLLVGVGLCLLHLAGCTDCERIKRDAQALLERHRACANDDECVLVNLGERVGANNCLLPFQCTAALSTDTDLDAFTREARALAEAFERCGECAQAGCALPTSATCQATTGLCETQGPMQ